MDDSQKRPRFRAAAVVAHPDDESLWAGGFILLHPQWEWTVVTLCRASDPDRAPRFRKVLDYLGAAGQMADLDDGPAQVPLPDSLVRQTVAGLLGPEKFNLVLTHGPKGEYTRHLRHEETCRAVAALWENGTLKTDEVRLFAYEDGQKQYLPRPVLGAHAVENLPPRIWKQKYHVITGIYGFLAGTFEARTTPRTEAFWCFPSQEHLRKWMKG